jgi:diaminohydroxyphosphoribosylaminopyrimidine deaminase/5-amino-6-(5-phosphoribosylamino)uracil reductase
MPSQPEIDAMRRALDLAASVDLSQDPNPRVGAVVLSPTGAWVAEGVHRGSGTPHAEVEALRAAGDRSRGATVVVTLEPCNHVGRTGPCTQALVDAGVRRVVYAQADPNPLATGGADTLRLAGLDVEGGVLAAAAAAVVEEWTRELARSRPQVTWKLAATLDGRSAAADGTSRWVTGVEARHDVHRLRARADAILVGTGTVVVDNPRLTVRGPDDHPLPRSAQPLRAVMGLRPLDPGRAVFDDAAETVRLTTRDPAQALASLAARGCRHVWLEGGPTLAAAFMKLALVDEVVAYIAPALLGAGPAAVAGLGIGTIGDAVRFDLCDVTRVGSDVRLTMKGRW